MNKRKYLNELFWELSYEQLLSMYMYSIYKPKDFEHKKDIKDFENDLRERLLNKWKSEKEINIWFKYIKEIAEEKMQDWL